MSSLFISFSSHNRTRAEALYRRLEARGYAYPFLSCHPKAGIPVGADWEQELYRNLRVCKAVLLLHSDHWNQSKWCWTELTCARALGKEVFPLRISEAPLPDPLGQIQTIDFHTGADGEYDQLWRGLADKGLSAGADFRFDLGACAPYPGLSAFDEAHAAVYFGRETEIEEGRSVLKRLRSAGENRLLLILGASGSGKSSLLRAGLLPRLKLKSGRDWLVLPVFQWSQLRQGETWEERLVANLRDGPRTVGDAQPPLPEGSSQPGTDKEWAALEELLREARDRASCVTAARRWIERTRRVLPHPLPPDGTVPVLPVDQFEELLSAAHESGSKLAFLRFLSHLLSLDDSPWLCVTTLRSDFQEAFDQHSELRELHYQPLQLRPMRRANYFEVVRRPAELAGITFEPEGLVNRIVDDVEPRDEAGDAEAAGEPAWYRDALPLLAFTLGELYASLGENGKKFTVSIYEAQLGGVQGCLQRAAEKIVPAAKSSKPGSKRPETPGRRTALPDPATEEALRRCFVGHLVQLDVRGAFLKRPARWAELARHSKAVPLLEQMINKRLLTSRSETRKEGERPVEERTVEVAHEVLFRAWGTLATWLDESRDDLRQRDQLEQAAKDWDEQGRSESYLWRRARLAGALERWAGRREELSEGASRFLNASRTAERRHRLAKAGAAMVGVLAVVGLLIAGYVAVLSGSRRAAAAADSTLAQAGDPVEALTHALRAVEILSPYASATATLPAFQRHVEVADLSLRRTLAACHLRALGPPPGTGTGGLNAVCFSPDGERIAAGGEDAAVTLFDAQTGQPTAGPLALGGTLASCAFSPDGKELLCRLDEGTLAILWDLETGSTSHLDHGPSLHHAAFAPSSARLIATAAGGVGSASTNRGEIILWRGASDSPGFVRSARREFIEEVRYVAFSPDGTMVLAVTGTPPDSELYWWKLAGDDADHPNRFGAPAVTAAEWGPGGTNLLTVHREGGISSVRVWRWPSGRLLASWTSPDLVYSAVFDPSGTLVLAACGDLLARVWNFLDSSEHSVAVLRGHQRAVTSARYNPAGTRVVTVSMDGTFRLWDAPEGDFAATSSVRDFGSASSVTNHTGDWRVCTSTNLPADRAGVLLWLESLQSPRRAQLVYTNRAPGTRADDAPILALAASSDDRYLVAGCRDRKVLLFEHPSGRWEHSAWTPVVLRGHADSITTVAFHPHDTAMFATGSSDRTVRLWTKVEDRWEVFAVLTGHTDTVAELEFTANGQTLVARTRNGQRAYSSLAWAAREELVPAARKRLAVVEAAQANTPGNASSRIASGAGGN